MDAPSPPAVYPSSESSSITVDTEDTEMPSHLDSELEHEGRPMIPTMDGENECCETFEDTPTKTLERAMSIPIPTEDGKRDETLKCPRKCCRLQDAGAFSRGTEELPYSVPTLYQHTQSATPVDPKKYAIDLKGLAAHHGKEHKQITATAPDGQADRDDGTLSGATLDEPEKLEKNETTSSRIGHSRDKKDRAQSKSVKLDEHDTTEVTPAKSNTGSQQENTSTTSANEQLDITDRLNQTSQSVQKSAKKAEEKAHHHLSKNHPLKDLPTIEGPHHHHTFPDHETIHHGQHNVLLSRDNGIDPLLESQKRSVPSVNSAPSSPDVEQSPGIGHRSFNIGHSKLNKSHLSEDLDPLPQNHQSPHSDKLSPKRGRASSTLSVSSDDWEAHQPMTSPKGKEIPIPKGHFPRSFGFYHSPFMAPGAGEHNVVLAKTQKKASSHKRRFMYITMQNDGGMHRKLEKKPWIIMHAGCTRKSPPLATIPTHRVHQKTPTINIDLAPVKPAGKQRKNLKKEYRYKKHRQNSKSESKHTLAWKIYRSWVIGRQNTLERSNSGHLSFQVKIDEVTEKFQWEVDEKPRQDELGRGPRTVLMRENTGEEVAAHFRPRGGKKDHAKLGTMHFLGSWKTLGRDFEILAVMSALVALKSETRTEDSIARAEQPLIKIASSSKRGGCGCCGRCQCRCAPDPNPGGDSTSDEQGPKVITCTVM